VPFEAQHRLIPSKIKFWPLLCLFAISSLFLPQARALDPTRLISQYGHTVWRIDDGVVPSGSPITQTADGYIWLVTQNRFGLLRFDGKRFVTWQPPKGTTLPGRVTCLLGARDGSLWIGTRAGVSRLKDGQLSTYTKPTDQSGIGTIIEDHAGKIWLTRYRVPKGEGPLCEVVADGLHCYGPSDGVSARYALGLSEDSGGYLWFASENLHKWKPGITATEYLESIAHPQIADVAVDHSGDVWAAMEEAGSRFGVRYFRNGVWGEYVTAGFRSSSVNANVLYVDRAGAVWIGADDGIYRVWGGAVDHYSRNDGLAGNHASGFYEDREGNLWVVTEGGIDLFRNIAVKTYSMDQGLGSVSKPTVLAANDGTIWTGDYEDAPVRRAGQFADILRPGVNQRFTRGPRLPGKIESMFQDHSGAFWLAFRTDLVVYQGGKIEKIISLSDQLVSDIIEDSTHTVLAVSDSKLFRIKDRRVLEAIPLPKSYARGGLLAANPKGGIWIVAQRGGEVALYQGGVMRSYPLPNQTDFARIDGALADNSDPLLLATGGGLLRWDGKRWHVLNEANGLPCHQFMGSIKDRSGSLWLQADCGLVKIEAVELDKWRQNPQIRLTFSLFDALDGARPGRSFQFQPVMSEARDGTIWFSNGRTIHAIDPDQVYKNKLPPPVHVEQLIADDSSYEPAGQPHLPPNTHNLEIDYTGLSFSIPQKVQFRYWLEGRDKSWQAPVTRRQAFYTDLPPGNYRFHVVACNNSGVWNETGAAADFIVEPTFYQTLWFKVLLAITIAGLLGALYLLRLKQATANVQARLFAQMEERERIARELHDTLLQGFQGITLRMQGVAKNMPIQDPLRKMIDSVLDGADEVLREARQRVRNLRRRTTDENELPDRLTKCGQELAKDHAVTFTLAIVGEPKVLESTVLDEAHRIVAEALTNAFRHASASKIETEVTYDSSALRIRVRDDGVGIDKAVLSSGQPGHWGLTGMRERAKAIRAEINIWSRDTAGTEVEIVVPASIAYPREELAS
jgi:signal transduction histidine kinase/ligand-binding sensor domain-containing protein